jgi:hypothetical protein
VLHSSKKGAQFKVSQKRTSYQPVTGQQNRLAALHERLYTTKCFSVSGATTLGRYLPRKVSNQIWVVQFNVVLGGLGDYNTVSRICSKSNARCSRSWHLTNGLFGRRGQRGVFPEKAVARAAQLGRWASKEPQATRIERIEYGTT